MKIAIPTQLSEYIKISDNEIIFKKEVPKELNNDFDKFKKEFELSKAMCKFISKDEQNILTVEEKEFENYCRIYEEKFGKKAYIAEPDGTMEKTITAIKICLEKEEDLLDILLYPNNSENTDNESLY